jgi:hypothetical protein
MKFGSRVKDREGGRERGGGGEDTWQAGSESWEIARFLLGERATKG